MKAGILYGDNGKLVLCVEGESPTEWTMLHLHGASFGLTESEFGDWRCAEGTLTIAEPAK